MKDHIRCSNLKTDQQAEIILTHLRGRAKDVVKFFELGIKGVKQDGDYHRYISYSNVYKTMPI